MSGDFWWQSAVTLCMQVVATIALAACSGPEAAGRPSVKVPPQGAPAPVKTAPRRGPASPAAQHDDVKQQLSAGSSQATYRLGAPALSLASVRSFGGMLSAGSDLAAISDTPYSVAVWDTLTGRLLRRISHPDASKVAQVSSYLLSPGGTWLAVTFQDNLLLYRAPFDGPPVKTDCLFAQAFSQDESRLICDAATPRVLDIASNKIIATAPRRRPSPGMVAVSFAQGNSSIYWIATKEVLKWDLLSSAPPSVLYTSSVRRLEGGLSEAADRAVVKEGEHFRDINLKSGASRLLPELRPTFFGLSPLGKQLVLTRGRAVQRYDLATGREALLAEAKGDIDRLLLSEDEDTLGFVEVQQEPVGDGFEPRATLRVLDRATGVRTYPAPSRFVRWVAADVAELARDGARSTLIASTGERGPASAQPDAPAAPLVPGAPPWATWVSEVPGQPDTRIVSEPRPRSGVNPDLRRHFACEPTMRLWLPARGTSPAHQQVLTSPCTPVAEDQELHQDPGWFHGGGWIVAATLSGATLYDARGSKVARLGLGQPMYDKPQFAHQLWNVALAPDGKHLALLWRRGDYGGDFERQDDPREDAAHIAESIDAVDCVRPDARQCQLEYFLEIWSLQRQPVRLWKERLTSSDSRRWRVLEPKIPSGPLTFDRSGTRVLVAFADGDVLIRSLTDKDPDPLGQRATAPLTSVHQVPITRLSLSPDGKWAFSEDASTEQRIWPVPAP